MHRAEANLRAQLIGDRCNFLAGSVLTSAAAAGPAVSARPKPSGPAASRFDVEVDGRPLSLVDPLGSKSPWSDGDAGRAESEVQFA